MNEQNRKRKQLAANDEDEDQHKTSSAGFENGKESIADTIGDGNSSNVVNADEHELKLKVDALESENAALKANNKLLEGKFGELSAQILLLTEENKALMSMKGLDQEIANNEKLADLDEQQEAITDNLHKRMEYFVEKLASWEERRQKGIAILEARYVEENKEIGNQITTLRKQMSTLMKIDLPTETWHDVFGFVPRRQLGQFVPQIGNWHFASKAQFHLHECGQITLRYMNTAPSMNEKGPIIVSKTDHGVSLMVVPIPENVNNFRHIQLSNFDETICRFLQELHRNSLLENVNLTLTHDGLYAELNAYTLMAFLTNFAVPLLTNINSIVIYGSELLNYFQDEFSKLAKPMLASARVLDINYNSHYDWYCEWLKTPRKDGKPRVLSLNWDPRLDFPISPFIEYIKKDFLNAKQAISFFVKYEICKSEDKKIQSHSLDNLLTKEKLVIKTDDSDVTISRHPSKAKKGWIEAEEKHGDNKKKCRNISFFF